MPINKTLISLMQFKENMIRTFQPTVTNNQTKTQPCHINGLVKLLRQMV